MELLLETVDGHSLTVAQTGLASGIGGVAWDCGLVLSRLLLVPGFARRLRQRLMEVAAAAVAAPVDGGVVDDGDEDEVVDGSFGAGFTALELGSGTGLVGMQLAMLGFKSVLTDLPSVMPQLAQNLAQNSHLLPDAASCLADVYIWGQEPPRRHFPVHLLAISDCLYSFEYIELLSQALRDIFANESHSPLVLHAYEDRHPTILTDFFERVGDFLAWEEVRLADYMAEDDLPADMSLMLMYRKVSEQGHCR